MAEYRPSQPFTTALIVLKPTGVEKVAGVATKVFPAIKDGFVINGKTPLNGEVEIDTYHDHRLAMSAYIAGLICEKPILINDFEWVNTSFPEFLGLINKIIKD